MSQPDLSLDMNAMNARNTRMEHRMEQLQSDLGRIMNALRVEGR